MMETEDGAELCFPLLLNTSCRKPTPSWSEAVLLHTVMSFVSVLTVALNLLVIISISHFRQLQIPTNLLLLSLSVSDFLVGFVFLPGEILRKTACWFLGDLMCSLYKCVSTIAVTASVVDMMLISVDRYVAICDPLRYPTRVTVRRIKVCIFLCWVYSALYSNLFLKDDLFQSSRLNSCRGDCEILIGYVSGTFDLVLNFIVPFSIIIVLYTRVFVVAVSQARVMRSHITAVTLHSSRTVCPKKSELKAARTLGIVVVVFLICFSPVYYSSFSGENSVSVPSQFFMLYLFCFNPCVNPVIYALFYPWFRKAVKLIVTLQILQPGSREANML